VFERSFKGSWCLKLASREYVLFDASKAGVEVPRLADKITVATESRFISTKLRGSL
jgi:hypothetical protein